MTHYSSYALFADQSKLAFMLSQYMDLALTFLVIYFLVLLLAMLLSLISHEALEILGLRAPARVCAARCYAVVCP